MDPNANNECGTNQQGYINLASWFFSKVKPVTQSCLIPFFIEERDGLYAAWQHSVDTSLEISSQVGLSKDIPKQYVSVSVLDFRILTFTLKIIVHFLISCLPLQSLSTSPQYLSTFPQSLSTSFLSLPYFSQSLSTSLVPVCLCSVPVDLFRPNSPQSLSTSPQSLPYLTSLPLKSLSTSPQPCPLYILCSCLLFLSIGTCIIYTVSLLLTSEVPVCLSSVLVSVNIFERICQQFLQLQIVSLKNYTKLNCTYFDTRNVKEGHDPHHCFLQLINMI